ncbi:hypothetical protein EJ110_NYTH08543 [Nymphaea thermarum]|nr:hypothetical protein EJ110_NYTH08543 [Nymphaea thermarum]
MLGLCCPLVFCLYIWIFSSILVERSSLSFMGSSPCHNSSLSKRSCVSSWMSFCIATIVRVVRSAVGYLDRRWTVRLFNRVFILFEKVLETLSESPLGKVNCKKKKCNEDFSTGTNS